MKSLQSESSPNHHRQQGGCPHPLRGARGDRHRGAARGPRTEVPRPYAFYLVRAVERAPRAGHRVLEVPGPGPLRDPAPGRAARDHAPERRRGCGAGGERLPPDLRRPLHGPAGPLLRGRTVCVGAFREAASEGEYASASLADELARLLVERGLAQVAPPVPSPGSERWCGHAGGIAQTVPTAKDLHGSGTGSEHHAAVRGREPGVRVFVCSAALDRRRPGSPGQRRGGGVSEDPSGVVADGARPEVGCRIPSARIILFFHALPEVLKGRPAISANAPDTAGLSEFRGFLCRPGLWS